MMNFNHLWRRFQLVELTEIMRQRDDVVFAQALNRMAIGEMTPEDIKLFKSRETYIRDIPQGVQHLHFTNDDVKKTNERLLSAMNTERCLFKQRQRAG